MPIAFPPEERGADWNRADAIAQKLVDSELQIDVTNLANIGAVFDGSVLDPGIGFGWTIARAVNLRNLGFDFEEVGMRQAINPAQQWNQRNNFDNGIDFIQYDWAQSNTRLAGISRDSTGAPLAAARVSLCQGNVIVNTVTSDGSGNYAFDNPGSGPFFIVAYKAGSPDVAGTTVNTLLPAAV